MLTIEEKLLAIILDHCRKAYPHECCGLLAGDGGEKKIVKGVYSLTNKNTERAADRYEIDPPEYAQKDREIQEAGMQVIGIYHSHPDHPPRPSETDFNRAWPVYSYLIVAVEKGEKFDPHSWVLNEDETAFQEEEFIIE
ncbi:MAG: Mov34/MPN/PAD-1 family protein [bacterium]